VGVQELERGYWPSYNVPYFEEVYNKSGYPQLIAATAARGPEYGEVLTGLQYQLAARAKIFRRDVGGVSDLPSLKHLLRYHNFTNEPYSGACDEFDPLLRCGELANERQQGRGSAWHDRRRGCATVKGAAAPACPPPARLTDAVMLP
jgi:hypothetical protein